MAFIGTDTIRPDGADKVRGRAKYAADYEMEHMLHVVVVRSERAHAEICVDIAEANEGAFVFTAKDLAENIITDIINDRPVLAAEKVRFYGEPVAVVAADTREQAVAAAKKVRVSYRDLPVYTEPGEAIAEGACPIHADGNLVGTFEHKQGEPEEGFAAADLVLSRTFRTPYQEHAYMEPDAGFSYWDGDVLTVVSSSQNVFHDQRMVMTALGLPEERVRVVNATVGGAFGGKDGHMTQIFGALVTQKTGCPAKIVFDRRESIACTYKRHSTELTVKMGFSRDGRILAFDADCLIDTGAYIGYGLSVLGLLSEHIPGPYRIGNVHVRSRLAYTNKTAASAFRGFGAPQAAFATESLISEAAAKLGIDPVDIRRTNALHPGDVGPFGQIIDHSCGMTEALDLLEQSALWQSRAQNTDPNVGYGFAAGHLSCGFGKEIPDQAEVVLEEREGFFRIYLGFTEIGQGSVTALRSIAADALGTDLEHVEILMSDTACTFDCGSTAASRSVFLGGNAIFAAAEEYRKRAEAGETDIRVQTAVPFPESKTNITVGVPHSMYTFVAQAVKLRVDPDTGEITLLDAAAVTEAGRVIHPMQLAGQVHGGMVQSLGFALGEGCRFAADGKMLNDSFSTYLLPTCADVPHLSAVHVNADEPSGPAGAKGAAESPTVPTAAAVNAAVHDATGIWHESLPITPESILIAKEAEQ